LHPTSPGWLIAAIVDVGLVVGTLITFAVLPAAGGARLFGFLLLPFAMFSTVFLPYGLFMVLWLSSGVESVTVCGGEITVRSIALGIPWHTRRLLIAQVSNIRFDPLANLNRHLMPSITMDLGSLAFDYGKRTMRFGRWLDPREAQLAVDALATAIIEVGDASAPERLAGVMELPVSRIRASRADGNLEIRMPFGNTPVNRRATLVGFGGLFLALPMIGFVMGSTFSSVGAFPGFGGWMGLAITALVLVMVVPMLSLSLTAVEIATLSVGTFEIRSRPVFLTLMPARRFDTRYMHNVRYEAPAPATDDIGAIWSKYLKGNHGQIAFGYGAEQHRFGQYVDGPEARDIADMLNSALAADPDAGTLALAAYQAGMGATNQPAGTTDRTRAST